MSPGGMSSDGQPGWGQQPEHGPQFYPAPPGSPGPVAPGPPGPATRYPAQQLPYYPGSRIPPGRGGKPHRRTPWIVGGALFLAVVLLGVAGIVWKTLAPRTPEAAAEHFLSAVSKSDAHQALELVDDPPQQRELLTDRVLHTMNAATPITDIHAHSESGTSVRIRYRVGDEPASRSVKTTKTSDGWKVTNGLTEVNAGARRVRGLAVSGAKVTRQRFFVFPGHYAARLTNRYLDIDHDSKEIATDDPRTGDTLKLRYQLTRSGARAARRSVIKQLNRCFPAKHTYRPGCGANTSGKLRGGGKVIKSSLAWRLESSELEHVRQARFSVHSDEGTLASSYASNRVRWRARCSISGQHRSCGGHLRIGTPQVDMAAKPLDVTWK